MKRKPATSSPPNASWPGSASRLCGDEVRQLQFELDALVMAMSGRNTMPLGDAERWEASGVAGLLYEANHALRAAAVILQDPEATSADENIVRRMQDYAVGLLREARQVMADPAAARPEP